MCTFQRQMHAQDDGPRVQCQTKKFNLKVGSLQRSVQTRVYHRGAKYVWNHAKYVTQSTYSALYPCIEHTITFIHYAGLGVFRISDLLDTTVLAKWGFMRQYTRAHRRILHCSLALSTLLTCVQYARVHTGEVPRISDHWLEVRNTPKCPDQRIE